MNVDYAAKGWPLIDPRSPDYCYQPCENGLHVCGFHPDGNNFLTIANIKVETAAEARTLFDKAMSQLLADDEGDFVIDLQMNGECEEDFRMDRQMLARLIAMSTPPAAQSEGGEA